MAIANSLKFRYLWIDSLCIIQDGDEEWKTQSRFMGLIYRNAVCNIAATWAVDSNDGYFVYRNRDTVRSCFVTLHQAFDMPSTYQIYDDNLYGLDIACAPLNSRGWVVQERYFAKRQLNFAKHQSDKLYAISGLITELEKLTGDSSHDDGLTVPWIEVVDIDENPVVREGSVEQKIVIKGVALRGRVTATDFIANTCQIILTDPIKAPNLPRLADILVDIFWDEVASNHDRRKTLTEERNSDLLFLVVLHRNDNSKHLIQGLTSRGLPVSAGGDMRYVRMGSFKENDGNNQFS
ncbi:heterokaryon incompatibility protein-domain-containing protein [Xylaria cubensis]|nr:heterokaryon incompatibility protein-domain-containing protein [Xylaria cubensis]